MLPIKLHDCGAEQEIHVNNIDYIVCVNQHLDEGRMIFKYTNYSII